MVDKPIAAPPPLDDGPLPNEPLLKTGGVGTVIGSVLALLVVFDVVHLTYTQQVVVLGAAATLAPVVTALIGRLRTYGPDTVRLLLRTERDRHTT